MSDETVPANSNVVPLGRGQFFAVDRRAWAKACDLGMNAAIAYLVMARGTGHDMRSTSWSAKAMQERTSVPWRQCKAAIQSVVASGLVRQDKGGQHPRYTVRPAHEVPGCVPGAKRPALSEPETRLVERLGDRRVWVPKTAAWNSDWRPNTKLHDLALALAKKGVLADHGGQFFSVISPVEDDKPDWIWLPNAVTDGAAGEEIPVELIRQTANQAALRLFVDLYHAQSLNDFGGVHWRQVRRTYDRHRVGERGSSWCGASSNEARSRAGRARPSSRRT